MKMKGTIGNKRAAFIVAAMVATAAVVVAFVSVGQSRSRENGTTQIHLHADHMSYDGLNNLVGAADAVFVGTVTATQPGTSIPAPPNPAGETQADIPQTDLSVHVDASEKGALAPGQTVTVTITGGAGPGGENIELEGVPPTTTGGQYVFFVIRGDDGKFYPLAGGSAIATKNSNGSFLLSGATTGGEPLTFTTTQLRSVPLPDQVTITMLSGPRQQIDGDVQDGSLSVARSGSQPTSIKGTVLVAGHDVSLDIAIAGDRATGTFAIDGVEYTLASPSVVPSSSGIPVRINGKATVGGSTREFHLEVVDR
jgi:hypothetical protein